MVVRTGAVWALYNYFICYARSDNTLPTNWGEESHALASITSLTKRIYKHPIHIGTYVSRDSSNPSAKYSTSKKESTLRIIFFRNFVGSFQCWVKVTLLVTFAVTLLLFGKSDYNVR